MLSLSRILTSPAIPKTERDMSGSAILIDHYRHPRCRGEVENPARRNVIHNRKCGDRIVLTSRPDHHGMLEVRFEGEGCMYCLASASILCSTLSGMKREDALFRIALFRKWLRGITPDKMRQRSGQEEPSYVAPAGRLREANGDEPGMEQSGEEDRVVCEAAGLTDEMQALGEVKAYPMRIDCADLAWKCADEMLQHDK